MAGERLRRVAACLVCGDSGERAPLIENRRDPRVPGVSIPWGMCRGCGVVSQPLRISGEDVYTESYRLIAPEIYARQESPLESAKGIGDWIAERVPPGRVLDVGCAAGNLLDRLARHGWETFGVEPTTEYARFAGERHRVESGFWRPELFPGVSFDLIVSTHVIEHVEDPIEMIRSFARRLAPGGRILLETPNLLRPSPRLWDSFLGVEHTALYSPATLAALCQRAGTRVDDHGAHWRGIRVLASVGEPDGPTAEPEYSADEVRGILSSSARAYPFRSWKRIVRRRLARAAVRGMALFAGRDRAEAWLHSLKTRLAERTVVAPARASDTPSSDIP